MSCVRTEHKDLHFTFLFHLSPLNVANTWNSSRRIRSAQHLSPLGCCLQSYKQWLKDLQGMSETSQTTHRQYWADITLMPIVGEGVVEAICEMRGRPNEISGCTTMKGWIDRPTTLVMNSKDCWIKVRPFVSGIQQCDSLYQVCYDRVCDSHISPISGSSKRISYSTIS